MTNQEVQPSQSAQTGTYTADTYLHTNLAPNWFHLLDDQLSLSDSIQASEGAVQSPGREAVHYPGLLPPQGSVHHFAEWHMQAL